MDDPNKAREIAQDEVQRAMRSQDFDMALQQALPDNSDFQQAASPAGSPSRPDGGKGPDVARPWEVRSSDKNPGKLQIYLPAGTDACLFLNGMPVPAATSLNLTASGGLLQDYYEVDVDDAAGPWALYRWFEVKGAANGRWMLGNNTDFAGQWNMGPASAVPGAYLCPTIIAVKDTSGVWIPCDNGCMDYSFTPGDAECAEGTFGGTTIPGAPKSINEDQEGGAQQLEQWTITPPRAAVPGDVVYCRVNGVGTPLTLTSAETGGDWTVDVDDVDAPSVLRQIRGSGTPVAIIKILPL